MSDHILNVMVVEDEPLLQDVYRMVLSSQGYRVSVANNGLQALQGLEKHEPDIILLDYFMPQMDGRTFLQHFDRDLYPHVKIVVVSNISDEGALQETLQLGAHSHVLKSSLAPGDMIELVEKTAGES